MYIRYMLSKQHAADTLYDRPIAIARPLPSSALLQNSSPPRIPASLCLPFVLSSRFVGSKGIIQGSFLISLLFVSSLSCFFYSLFLSFLPSFFSFSSFFLSKILGLPGVVQEWIAAGQLRIRKIPVRSTRYGTEGHILSDLFHIRRPNAPNNHLLRMQVTLFHCGMPLFSFSSSLSPPPPPPPLLLPLLFLSLSFVPAFFRCLCLPLPFLIHLLRSSSFSSLSILCLCVCFSNTKIGNFLGSTTCLFGRSQQARYLSFLSLSITFFTNFYYFFPFYFFFYFLLYFFLFSFVLFSSKKNM